MKFTRLNNTILNKGFFRFIAPGSKSVTNRALIMLGLNENKAALENILIAEDTLVMINALYDLGAELIFDCKVNILTKTGICQPRNRNVYLGYAGTAYRFLLPYLLTMRGKFKMYGEEELHKRPITELISCMKNLVDGMVYEDTGNRSIYCEINKLKNISSVSVDPVKSSQFLTALLLVIPVIYDKFTIECTNKPVSSTYIDLTMDMLKKTGINIEQENYSAYKIFGKQKYNFLKYNIEGDYSAASYFFALSAISGIRSEILNLDCLSKQGDKKFIEILERMGCVVNYKNSCNSIEILPPEKLRSAGEIDMSKMQDVVPTAAVAAVFAEGETKIVNIENLKYKECDRFKAIITELRKIGARIEYGTDWIKIYGTDDEKKYLPAEIETYKDHRMAMSFSLAALKIPGLIIKSPECVCKTFPDFYKSFLPLFENMDKEPENYYSEIYKKELIKFQNNINNK